MGNLDFTHLSCSGSYLPILSGVDLDSLIISEMYTLCQFFVQLREFTVCFSYYFLRIGIGIGFLNPGLFIRVFAKKEKLPEVTGSLGLYV